MFDFVLSLVYKDWCFSFYGFLFGWFVHFVVYSTFTMWSFIFLTLSDNDRYLFKGYKFQFATERGHGPKKCLHTYASF